MTPDINNYREQIEAALKYADGSHSFDDIVAAIEKGRMQPWFGPNSVMITELLETPGYKWMNVFLAGGELPELEQLTPVVLAWAKAEGCTKAIFAGRPGWERTFLTRTGWEKSKLVVLEKQL